MSLNIKDPEAHKLARELAAETGDSMTSAVTIALKEKLHRVRQARKAKATADELLQIARKFRAHLQGPVVDHGIFLYDERGLPK
jgi:antitoxin VapB